MASPTPSPTAPSPTTSSSSPPPAATPPTSSPSTPSPPPPSSTSSPPSPPSSSTKSRPPPPSSSSSKSPPPPPSFSTSTSSSGISTGAVAGIAIAGMAVLVSLCLSWKKRRRRSNDRSVPPPPPGDNTYNSTQGRSNLEMMRNLEDVTTVDDGASSSIAPGSTHEVFLSFRGVDTRLNFTDHLYNYLRSVGVQTFRDNEELRVGEEIGPDLIKAIEESSISIPIFSKGYASSKWCLRELTHMVKCMNDIDPEGRRRHTVCPIFYDVTPEHVKRQTGSFAEAFVKHTKEVDACTVQEWKDALKEVCELKGWEKDKIADGHEAELIKKIVTEVCEKLKKRNVSLTDDLVGMDHHMEEMTKLLDNGGNDVRIVGIVGMGGIGKTTIAKFMYNKLCDQFQPQCSFLEDVRERVKRNGYAELRKQLTSDVLRHTVDRITIDKNTFRDKKVLIVFDDVEDKSQLKDVIGGRESQLATHNYFGSGSTIIVTTRNKEVFEELDGDLIYEPSGMDPDDSLLLFCKYAFKSSRPKEGYEEISREVVQTASGLPLSLVVIGSMLFLKKRKQWEATLKKLKTIPAKDVQKKLKISYEALDHGQKQMFLDIACHFIGKDKTLPFYMWQDCGLNPESEGIDVLVSLSLVTIEKNRYTSDNDIGVFRMHDHLIDLGRDIVKQENHCHPGKRSRLWSSEEARDVLDNQSGTEKVETFSMNYVRDNDDIIYDFKGLSSLRYLCLKDVRLKGDFKGLVSNLRWFRWSFSNEMRITNFCAKKLVILDLKGSKGIRDGWESEIQIKAATNLKVLRLRGCGSLTKIPECLWNMKSMVELDLSGTEIAELSEQCIGNLTNLKKLLLSGSWIKMLPDAIGRMKKLEVLNCSWCISLEGQLPEGIGRLSSLRVLDFTATKITGGLPKDISGLQNLRTLNLGEKVQLPVDGFKLPHSLKKLSIPLTEASVNGVRGLVNLRALKFHKNVGYCCEPVAEEEAGVIVDHRNNGIPSLPIIDMPSNLERLSLRGLDDHVMSCRLLPAMKFDCSSRLDMLWIDNCTFRTLPTGSLDLSNFQVFKQLRIEGCNKMRETADFGSLLGYTWEWIDISDCQSLEVLLLSNLSSLKRLKTLEIRCCLKLREIKGREVLTSLERLIIFGCPHLMGPDLSNCQMLKELSIDHCDEIREIKGLEALTSLVRLYVDNCPLLKEDELLRDLSKLKSLKIVTWNKKEICIPEE